jgi:hypothetical protein
VKAFSSSANLISPRLPKNFNNFFPNIETIQLFNSKIKVIDKDDLQQFPKLKSLFVGLNQLESLKSDLFEYNPNLLIIKFNYNSLRSIGSDLLKPLTKLFMADFSNNPCIDTNVTNNKTGIEELKKELAEKCPPSNEVEADEILYGNKTIEVQVESENELKGDLKKIIYFIFC